MDRFTYPWCTAGALRVLELRYKSVEEGVTSEDERITENLNSGDEVKPRYLETLQKYASYQNEFSTLQSPSQNTAKNTAVLGAVAEAVKKQKWQKIWHQKRTQVV